LDTIFALSSGSPPAAIAIVRISGPAAGEALVRLTGRLPQPRQACLGALRDPVSGELLDRALLLWFPGPASSTGEDLAELHLHGARSVVAAILDALAAVEGLRAAEPGEFTRRAFQNGRIDLAEAEGLADLLTSETQSQRRAALALAGGGLSSRIGEWQRRLLLLAAQLEAVLDFSDEGDVAELIPEAWIANLRALAEEIDVLLAQPRAERLRDGIRVVIAGPPNAGKSSLLNVIAGREAAITSAIAGTTRDLVEVPGAISGTPFLFIDTAGLRDSEDEVEAIGVARAGQSIEAADIILWLGAPELCPCPDRSIIIQSKSDLPGTLRDPRTDLALSAHTGAGIQELTLLLLEKARHLLPSEGDLAINNRHAEALGRCHADLEAAAAAQDPLVAAEELRHARLELDRVTGKAGVEEMLDALFSGFCIGK